MASNANAVEVRRDDTPTPIRTDDRFSRDQIDLIKQTVAVGATDLELRFFLENAARTGLDPLMRQIYFVKRKGKGTIQVGIDGLRLIADRTRCYVGSDEPVFDRENAPHPNKASVTVWKLVAGQRCPFTASARWSEYCPEEGQDFQWQRMPYLMLAKCAEAQALRKGFPAELSGVYVDAEMDQAGPGAIAPVPAAVVEASGSWVDTGTGEVIDVPPPTTPPTPRADRITQQDMRRLHAAARERKVNHDDLHGIVRRKFDLQSTKDLSRTMLDDLVTWLNEATDEEIADELMALAVDGSTPVNAPMPGMPAAPQEPSGFWNS